MRQLLASLTLALLALPSLPAWASQGFWALGGEFLDDHGRSRTLSEFANSPDPTLIAMEYTECRFVCSVGWRRLVELQSEADRLGRKVQFVIISLDPEHDTPALWREYRQMRSIKRDNWVFLTGKRPSTDLAAQRLGVRWWRYDGNLMHDFRVVRMGPKGQVAAVLDNYDEPVTKLLRP